MSDAPFPKVPGYVLHRELGVGGMATVYLATQTSLDRKVAIKVMHVSAKDEMGPERIEKRFLREGRMLARLTHRNVCGIYDISKGDDFAYIAMEYIEGGTLGDHLRRGMTAAEALGVVVQLAGALAAAHALGIVHRDLKPANVMMRGRVPVLTDFGIARDLSPDRTEITGDSILGTPNYMSPEQISGRDIDGRADIYSLGAMLFELLAGRRPYEGDSPIAVCMQHLQAPIPELPEKFAELQPVIDGMMAKDREERFPDMDSVVAEIRGTLVDSESLREALQFTTDVPWSEQMRDLGFSFESTAGGRLRAAVRNPQSTARQTGRLTQPLKPQAPTQELPPPGPAPRRFGLRERVIAAIVVLALVAAGLWWGLSEERLSEEQMVALDTMVRQFDRQIGAEQLTAPKEDSALNSLRGMYAISRTHKKVRDREAGFRKAVEQEVAKLEAENAIGAARALLTDSAALFEEDAMDALLARLDQAQERQELAMTEQRRQELVLERVSEVDGILAGPDAMNDPRLAPAMSELVALKVTSDEQYQDLINRIIGLLNARLQASVQAGSIADASAVRDRLREWFPDSQAATAAATAVLALEGRALAASTQAQVLALLREERITPENVDAVLAGLLTMESGGLTAESAAAAAQLRMRVAANAERALAAKDLLGAHALLDPALQRFPDDAALKRVQMTLTNAETALAEERRADEEAKRAGRLVLDASPWGKVVSVAAQGGAPLELSAERITPLQLTVPEGEYLITIEGPDGRTRQQSTHSVRRGQISVAVARFAALDADTYLRQAGYR